MHDSVQETEAFICSKARVLAASTPAGTWRGQGHEKVGLARGGSQHRDIIDISQNSNIRPSGVEVHSNGTSQDLLPVIIAPCLHHFWAPVNRNVRGKCKA